MRKKKEKKILVVFQTAPFHTDVHVEAVLGSLTSTYAWTAKHKMMKIQKEVAFLFVLAMDLPKHLMTIRDK